MPVTTALSLWNGTWVIHDDSASADAAFVPASGDLLALPPMAQPLVMAMLTTARDTAGAAHLAVADANGNHAELVVTLGLDRTAEVRITGSIEAPATQPAIPDALGITDIQLLDISHEGLWVMDPGGQSAYVNPRMAAMLGWDARALTGRSLLSVVDEADRQKMIALLDGRTDSHNPVGSQLGNIRFCAADGSTVWAQLSVNRIVNRDGRTSAVIAVISDASAQRRREQELLAQIAAMETHDGQTEEPHPTAAGPRTPVSSEPASPSPLEPPRPEPGRLALGANPWIDADPWASAGAEAEFQQSGASTGIARRRQPTTDTNSPAAPPPTSNPIVRSSSGGPPPPDTADDQQLHDRTGSAPTPAPDPWPTAPPTAAPDAQTQAHSPPPTTGPSPIRHPTTPNPSSSPDPTAEPSTEPPAADDPLRHDQPDPAPSPTAPDPWPTASPTAPATRHPIPTERPTTQAPDLAAKSSTEPGTGPQPAGLPETTPIQPPGSGDTPTQQPWSDLESTAQAYREVFTHAPTGMAIIELDGRVLEANAAMEALLDPNGTADRPLRLPDLVEPGDQETLAGQLAALRSGAASKLRTEVRLTLSEGDTVWTMLSAAVVNDPDGRPAYAIAQAEDITERRVAEHDLVYQTLHDPLTGLANRLLLRDELQQALNLAHDVPFAVMFLDLDQFKSVNDTYGHDAGDALLVGVSERLRRIVRGADTVARLGGDEFAIIAQGIGDRDGARILAEKVRAALRAPFRVRDLDLVATASLGVVIGSRNYSTGEQLLRDADLAMYRAKTAGRDRFELFDDEIRLQEMERLETERTLQAALDRDGLQLHYQPVIDLHTGRAVGAEALLRISDSNGNLLTPGDFLGVAEDSRLILDVGAWMLREVCGQLARWADAGFGHLAMWVNVTGSELKSPRFGALVQQALLSHRVDPARLHVECTENVLLGASPSTIEHLRDLAATGVTVGIDDFGAGFSSISYLPDLPVSFLKIDAAFTRRLGAPGGESMVEAIVGLGRSLGLQIVAEGVESMAQVESLAQMGCDLAQGHLFAHPGPIDTLLLRDGPAPGTPWS